MSLFEKVSGDKTPEKVLETLWNLNRLDSYNQEAFSIENISVNFENKVEKMPEGVNKTKTKKEKKRMLNIDSKILDFYLNEQKQIGRGLKILTPSQMLSTLPVSLAQLEAQNN